MNPKGGRRAGTVASGLFVIASILFGSAAYADTEEPTPIWARLLQGVPELVFEGRTEESLSVSTAAVGHLLAWSAPDDSLAGELARGAFWRAISEYYLGYGEDAAWHLAQAVAIDRGVTLEQLGFLLDNAERLPEVDGAISEGDAEKLRALLRAAAGEGGATLGEDEAGGDQSPAVPPEEFDQVTPPTRLYAPQPSYPTGARAARLEGMVVLGMLLERDGTVSRPTIVRSSGSPALDYEAMETVRRWKFEPARIGDRPVSVFYNLTLNFQLRK